VEWVIVPLLVRLMTTLLDEFGITPPTQLPGVSQSPPVGAAVVFQVMVERSVRSSRPSIVGLRFFDRLRSAWRRIREEPKSSTLLRGERLIESHPDLLDDAKRVNGSVRCVTTHVVTFSRGLWGPWLESSCVILAVALPVSEKRATRSTVPKASSRTGRSQPTRDQSQKARTLTSQGQSTPPIRRPWLHADRALLTGFGSLLAAPRCAPANSRSHGNASQPAARNCDSEAFLKSDYSIVVNTSTMAECQIARANPCNLVKDC
jgi:hypothetical protein